MAPVVGKVFISHSSKDKTFVDRLASDLARHSIPVWYDKLEIRIGDSVPGKVNEAISSAKYLIIVLSPSSIASKWVQEELNAGLVRQIAEQGTFLLPVLLSDCTIPPLLSHRHYADFRSDYEAGLQSLLSLWGKDAEASEHLSDKILHPWPDIENHAKEYIYLHSTRFDKFFRMSCALTWSANYAIDYIVNTLSLPWNSELTSLGMRWSFRYGLIFSEKSIPLSYKLHEAGVTLGEAVKLSISGTYEDLYDKELREMWDGTKMYEVSGALRRQAELKEAQNRRGPLTSSRLREIADSCFTHLDQK